MSDQVAFIRDQLEKVLSFDADLRFMALSDMAASVAAPEFSSTAATDPRLVDRMVQAVLDKLQDPISEVQNQSVRCLEALVRECSEGQVTHVVQSLIKGDSGASTPSIESNITCTALRAVVQRLQASSRNARLLARLLVPWIVSETSVDVVDIGIDFIRRFGSSLNTDEIATLETHLVKLLNSQSPMIQKRAVAGLAQLARYLDKKSFKDLVDHCEAQMDTQPRIIVTLLGALASGEPSKLSPYASRIFPRVYACLAVDKEDEDDEDAVLTLLELRESVLYALEGFLKLDAAVIDQYVPDFIEASTRFLTYDPNYIGDGDDDDDMEEEEDDEDEDDDEDDDYGDYSDDEDQSWKLRRYAAKLAGAITTSCGNHFLPVIYSSLFPTVVKRLGVEREVTVTTVLLSSLATLITAAGPNAPYYAAKTGQQSARRASDASMRLETDPVDRLDSSRVKVIQVTSKWLGNAATAALAAAVLKALVESLDGNLLEVVPQLHKVVRTNKTLTNDALDIVGVAIRKSNWSDFTPEYLTLIEDLIYAGLTDSFFKVPVAAIECVSDLLATNPDYELRAENAALIVDRAASTAVDSEIRVKAVSILGKLPPSEETLAILLRSLENETFRLASITAIRDLVLRNLVEAASPWTDAVSTQLQNLLRQSLRLLRLSALETLRDMTERNLLSEQAAVSLVQAFLQSSSDRDDPQLFALEVSIITDVFPLVSSSNLVAQVIQLPLSLLHVSNEALAEAFIGLYQQVTSADPSARQTIYEQITANKLDGIAPQVLGSVVSGDAALVSKYSTAVSSGEESHDTVGDLLTLGYIGAVQQLEMGPDVFQHHLMSSSEVVKYAAAVALGNAAKANPSFIEYVTSLVQNTDKGLIYLGLVAVREYIKSSSADPSALFSQLFQIRDMDDNIQSVTSECVGRICTRHREFTPQLRTYLLDNSGSANTKAVVLSSLRYIFGQSQELDESLNPIPMDLVDIASHSSAASEETRKLLELALACLNSVLHNAPQLALPIVPNLVKMLIDHTHVNDTLIRQVQMGPFKLKVDDGLSLRKTTYDSVLSLLTNVEQLSMHLPDNLLLSLFERLLAGLVDEHDVQILALVCIPRAIQVDSSLLAAPVNAPGGPATAISVLINSLNAGLNREVKESAIKQEFEKKNEIQRNILRAIGAISKVLEEPGPLTDVEVNSWNAFAASVERFK